jgi:hypothetical protein
MSSANAITEDVSFVVRMASFYELSSDEKNRILKEVSDLMVELGKRYEFIVWRVSMEGKDRSKQ